MKKYGLLKSNPKEYSFDDLLNDKKILWTKISSIISSKKVNSLNIGDELFFYHSGNENKIVGIVEVISDAKQNPNYDVPKFFAFEIQPIKKLKRPIELWEIKSHSELKQSDLVQVPELDFLFLDKNYWDLIINLSEK
ncbi:MAG: EVE domain-containing protein [Ignavibacterium sp.]